MIEIGKKFVSSWVSAQQKQRTQKKQYAASAQEALAQAYAAQQAFREQTDYLFRSSGEKLRRIYEQAQQALASRRAARAAHGVSGQSASAEQDAATTQLNTQVAAARVQDTLQQAGAAQEKTARQKWLSLLQAAGTWYSRARQNGRWGRFGRALTSLFK